MYTVDSYVKWTITMEVSRQQYCVSDVCISVDTHVYMYSGFHIPKLTVQLGMLPDVYIVK